MWKRCTYCGTKCFNAQCVAWSCNSLQSTVPYLTVSLNIECTVVIFTFQISTQVSLKRCTICWLLRSLPMTAVNVISINVKFEHSRFISLANPVQEHTLSFFIPSEWRWKLVLLWVRGNYQFCAAIQCSFLFHSLGQTCGSVSIGHSVIEFLWNSRRFISLVIPLQEHTLSFYAPGQCIHLSNWSSAFNQTNPLY